VHLKITDYKKSSFEISSVKCRGGSILARVELGLAVVRLYLTRIDSYEEAAGENSDFH
jgi:hypothetical protein